LNKVQEAHLQRRTSVTYTNDIMSKDITNHINSTLKYISVHATALCKKKEVHIVLEQMIPRQTF